MLGLIISTAASKLQWLQLERCENQQPTCTWTSHVAITTADVDCLWCDWTHVAWQRPTYGWQEFLKKPQTCLVGVFCKFHGIFSIIRHLSREPDFSAKNRSLKKFLKCLKACLIGVFWVFQSIFSIVRHLGREPDFLAENRIFKKNLKSLKTCLVDVFWISRYF